MMSSGTALLPVIDPNGEINLLRCSAKLAGKPAKFHHVSAIVGYAEPATFLSE